MQSSDESSGRAVLAYFEAAPDDQDGSITNSPALSISRTATSLELEDSGRRAIRAEYVEVRAARLGTRLCTSMSPVGELVR